MSIIPSLIALSVNIGSRRTSLSNGIPEMKSEEKNLKVWYFCFNPSIRHLKGAWIGDQNEPGSTSSSITHLASLNSLSLIPPSKYK